METLFVSSTFQDMMFERDAIRDLVLPRLNAEAQKYGQSVAICDLRWGINTQDLDDELANRKILEICLDEIAQSASPMIVILGERYGWMPPVELIRSAAAQRKLDLDDLQISVTALEIEYGLRTHQEDILFYFREFKGKVPGKKYQSEDLGHHKKLEELKALITQQAGGRVHTFQIRFDGMHINQDDIQHFADMVYEDVCRTLMGRWSKHRHRTSEELEREKHWAYIREKSSIFRARLEQANMIVQRVLEGERSIVIKGSPGSGKSTLLSKTALILSEYNMTVIPVACGLTAETSTAGGVLRQIVGRLELELKSPLTTRKANLDTRALRGRLNELCTAFEVQGQKLVIIVDAVDQLMQDEDRDNMVFLPSSGSAHTIVTCLPHIVCRADMEFSLPPIGAADKKAVIRRTLEQHHRELPDNVINELIKKEASDIPLYLSLMLQRLMMMSRTDFDVINLHGGSMEEISRYQIDMIQHAPDSLEAMSAELIQTVGNRIDSQMVREVNEYLALSRFGLRESDLAQLLEEKWNYLAFRQMLNYMRENYMLREDGRYDFTHQSIRRGIQQACQNQAHRHYEIWTALHKLDKHDPVRISEMIYHCMRASNGRKYFIDHIFYYRKEPAILSGAANCAYAASLIDGGKWMSDLFENAEQSGSGEKLIWLFRFFDRYCCGLFLENYTESRIKLRILTQESGLVDRLARTAGESLAKSQMECYRTCAITAKSVNDDSRESYTEKYLSIGKKLYQDGILDDQRMWGVYYQTITLLKDAPDEKCWRRGVEVAEEALDSGLLDKLLKQDVDIGIPLAFYGSLGETYSRLGEHEKCLKLYQKDLELRKENAQKRPTAKNFFYAGGGYHNVGNALLSLQRFEEARLYYEQAIELEEKYSAGKSMFGKLFALRNDFSLCYNYSIALFMTGKGLGRMDQVAEAFAYKKESIRLYKRYHQEEQTFPKRFQHLAEDLGSVVSYLVAKDKSQRELYISEMCRIFDDFLTEDEGRLVLDASMENMMILESDFQGIFCALKNISDIQTVERQYQGRCRDSFIQYFDNRIKKAEKSTTPQRDYLVATEYYNKSLALLHLQQKVFLKEALELAVIASQMLERAEQAGNCDPRSVWAMEAIAFCHSGNCFAEIGDGANALRCFKVAVDKSALAAKLSDEPKDKLLLNQYMGAYEAAKRSIVHVPQREPAAGQKPKPPERQISKNADGTSTVTYADGSRYTGTLLGEKRHGTGTLILNGGKGTYTGQWKNDLKDGYGEIIFPSGASYRGEWEADEICGYGIRVDIYGKKTSGLWKSGILIKPVSEMKTAWILRKYKL